MAEATIDPNQEAEAASLRSALRDIERARIVQIGSLHFAMVVSALTLWGAAEMWAQLSGLGVARLASVGQAIVAGFVIVSTIHEWGHFAGARLSGAVSPVFEAPKRHFFLFDFPIDRNDTRQFTWMSWGGILAPWLAVLGVAIFVPLGTIGAAALLATLVARAVAAGAFEVPVVLAAARSGDPGAELGRQASSGGLPRSRRVGAAVGAACFALLWLT